MPPLRKFGKSEVLQVYESHPLSLYTIVNRLRASGADMSVLTEADLAIDNATELTDQNHIGGLSFVRQLAEHAGVTPKSKVLDLGCGLGGSARALAWMFGCRVHGIDFSATRCQHARRLNQLVGLTRLVSVQCGDFMTAQVPTEHFDVVWGQSAWCHISDRTTLIRRWSQALKLGGRIAIEDAVLLMEPAPHVRRILSRLEGQWKAYLVPIADWLGSLRAAGFTVRRVEDVSAAMIDHFAGLIKASHEAPIKETIAWKDAVRLGECGIIGYMRLIAELSPTEEVGLMDRQVSP